MSKFKNVLSVLLLCLGSCSIWSQHFLQTNGKAIVNENQETILLRGMGLGGWMVQEGYMLQTASFANPQHQIRSTIEALIGKSDTDLFYEAWLDNHVRRSDIDSLKSWGFNSVRLPMHYNLFTLPIEEEPEAGQDTWLERGFELTDNLIAWCKANEMYVILDMHAAPGGQGYDEGISDYDPTKPSLWESDENKRKLVALWRRIAERYSDEQWVGGYDILNEPNWNLPGGVELRALYEDISEAIREVDNRHILFIEGNWFANDFTGLTPPWDDNFVYAPHKYWSNNDEATLKWVTDMRDQYNVPLYLGESGENSNVWFRDAIALLEDLDIGWAWWPMKKIESIAGPLSIIKSPDYQELLDYWNGEGPVPAPAFAKFALMDLTEKLKTENCIFQKDVIDAMFRQVYSDETIPFNAHNIPGVIHASDYDLGVLGEAYYDLQTANYQVSTGTFTAWNDGWAYRNDGVDIERSENTINSNGFNVGFIDAGEWMQYTINVEQSGVYEAHIRAASGSSGGHFHFSLDEAALCPSTFIGSTGGWQNWETTVLSDIILSEGDSKLRFHTDIEGFNISSFEFVKTNIQIADLACAYIFAETKDEMTLQLHINKPVDPLSALQIENFEVRINGQFIPLAAITLDSSNRKIIEIKIDHFIKSTDVIKLSYSGIEVIAEDQTLLQPFNLETVKNTISAIHQIPGKIEAEDYTFQSGVTLESTSDTGGGQNIGYLDPDDYLDYQVDITEAGNYKVDFRTAAEFGTGGLDLQLLDDFGNITTLSSPTFASTGGWQTWSTTTEMIYFPKGRRTLRLLITQSPFNLNWINFDISTSVEDIDGELSKVSIFPNPHVENFFISADLSNRQDVSINILDLHGKLLFQKELRNVNEIDTHISTRDFLKGVYILNLELEDQTIYSRRIIKL